MISFKEMFNESNVLNEGFRDLLRKFIKGDLGEYYETDDNGFVILLTKTNKLGWQTVESIENALYDVGYDFIYVDENGKEDKKSQSGTEADIKITSRVRW